jgi:hypothetical protein
MMNGFKLFVEAQTEEEKNVQALIKKLPKGHQKLLKGYKFKYQGGNTLKGDDGHIGVIFKDKITVAAPWNYGREFTTLHEIAHLVFEYLCTKKWKDEWNKIANKNPKQNQDNNEENFAMAYACHFAKHKIKVHDHPTWEDYMNRFCKATG